MHFVTDDTFPWTLLAQAPFILPILPLVVTKVLVVLIVCVFAYHVFRSSLFSSLLLTHLGHCNCDPRHSLQRSTALQGQHTPPPRNILFTWPQPRSSSRLPIHQLPWKAPLEIFCIRTPRRIVGAVAGF